MKILYCVPALYNPGGMERILIEKANYLSELKDFEVHIITTDQDNRPIYFELSSNVRITHLNLDFNQFFAHPIISKFFSIKKLLKSYRSLLEEYIRKENIDVLVSLGGKELEFLYKMNVPCRRFCELHFSISIREQFLQARGNSLLYKLIGKYRTKQIIKQTKYLDKLIVLTKSDYEKLRCTHSNLVQIYNFSPIDSAERIDGTSKIIVAVGKLDPQKGFDLLIESCSYIKDWQDWQLHIYGQGPDEKMLKEKIKSLNLDHQIILKGTTRHVSEVYKNAGIYVLSSRYEGFPMVLVEALSFGLPLVSFDCVSGPNELIVNNDCGILVEDGNTKKLGEAISEMLRSPQLRKEKSIIAFNKSKIFSKEEIMKQWIKLFKEKTT